MAFIIKKRMVRNFNLPKICFFVIYYLSHSASGLTIKSVDKYSFQKPYLFDAWNSSLDHAGDIKGTRWEVPRNLSKWMEYYASTSSFQSHHEDSRTCAFLLTESELEELQEREGIWVACQDLLLDTGCASISGSPCHPFMSYDTGSAWFPMRTVKIKFMLYELGILRLSIGRDKACVDYALRKDAFSSCEFRKVHSDRENGWFDAVFTFDPEEDISFTEMRIDMIARFAKDVVIVDKVEVTELLLCEDGVTLCPTPPAPSTTTEISPSTDESSEPTEEESESTSPTVGTTDSEEDTTSTLDDGTEETSSQTTPTTEVSEMTSLESSTTNNEQTTTEYSSKSSTAFSTQETETTEVGIETTTSISSTTLNGTTTENTPGPTSTPEVTQSEGTSTPPITTADPSSAPNIVIALHTTLPLSIAFSIYVYMLSFL